MDWGAIPAAVAVVLAAAVTGSYGLRAARQRTDVAAAKASVDDLLPQASDAVEIVRALMTENAALRAENERYRKAEARRKSAARKR